MIDSSVPPGDFGVGFQPVLREDRRIARPRLLEVLRRRFENRVTLVRGPAGYGKSTLLAEAIANNRLDPIGVDVLATAGPFDADPSRLLSLIGSAIGLEIGPSLSTEAALRRIVDQIWTLAPSEVALIIDDAHLVANRPCVEVLDLLVAGLPTNGHLVLAGRQLPTLTLTRLRAQVRVESVEPDDFLLDDDELARLQQLRGLDAALDPSLPRAPALADLCLSLGPSAPAQFLWEEVLDGLDADRLSDLSRLSVADQVDDALVRELTDGRWSAMELLADLPLADLGEGGRWRLHGLLREALVQRSEPAVLEEATRRASKFAEDRGDLVTATVLLADTGDRHRVLGLLARFSQEPQMAWNGGDYEAMADVASRLAPDSVVGPLLATQARYHGYERVLIDAFVDLARSARRGGEPFFEAVAILRAAQGLEQFGLPLPEDVRLRIGILASEDAFARAVDAHIGTAALMSAGDLDQVGELSRHFEGFSSVTKQVVEAERLCQMARFEEVAAGQGLEQFTEIAPGLEHYVGLALWIRGEVSPESALELVEPLIRRTAMSGPRYASLASLAVGVKIALSAGAQDQARAWAGQAEALEEQVMAPGIRCYSQLARALVALADEDPEPMGTLDVLMPSGRWVWQAALLAVPELYVHCPDVRPILDRAALGSVSAVGRCAGQALAFMHAGENERAVQRAGELPWGQPWILRNQILPADLVRLAAMAAEAGSSEAAEVAVGVPGLRHILQSFVFVEPEPGARWVGEMYQQIGASADLSVELRAFGSLEIVSPGSSGNEDPLSRTRVRELLALLVEFRSLSRATAAELLWPDLPADKAAANLRVNLNHLQRAMASGEVEGAPGAAIETERGKLALGPSCAVDVDRVEALVSDGRQLEQVGVPAEALVRYVEAMSLVSGPYLDGIDHPWLEASRSRWFAVELATRCRIGELLLAKGEPEQAMKWAVEASRRSPLDERSGRLVVSCLDAIGDRAGALDSGERLSARLEAAGLSLQPLTQKLLDRLRGR